MSEPCDALETGPGGMSPASDPDRTSGSDSAGMDLLGAAVETCQFFSLY